MKKVRVALVFCRSHFASQIKSNLTQGFGHYPQEVRRCLGYSLLDNCMGSEILWIATTRIRILISNWRNPVVVVVVQRPTLGLYSRNCQANLMGSGFSFNVASVNWEVSDNEFWKHRGHCLTLLIKFQFLTESDCALYHWLYIRKSDLCKTKLVKYSIHKRFIWSLA